MDRQSLHIPYSSFLKICALALLLQTLPVNATGESAAPADNSHRFYMGVYYPAIINLNMRADFQVAINYWLDEFCPLLNLTPSKAQLFKSMEEMRQAFENGELDLILAPPILLAKHIDRDKLAGGFVGTSTHPDEYGTVLIVRRDKHIKDIKDLAGKKLLLPENDDLAELFLETLIIKSFKKHSKQVFSQVSTKEKQSAVVLGLFFNQADAGMTYREFYDLMVEMNPQIKDSLEILASFPIKSPNYSYFHRDFPEELRHKLTEKISELNTQTRPRQILNDLRMTSLVPCSVDDLRNFDKLLEEYNALEKTIKK